MVLNLYFSVPEADVKTKKVNKANKYLLLIRIFYRVRFDLRNRG